MTGEALHAAGADGAKRAKRWLEATTRAEVWWVNPHPNAIAKLTFTWATGTSFSFDLGGILVGGDVDHQEFLAESKYYSNANDQLKLYTEYLAKCYRAYQLLPARCDHFVWITWAAFGTTVWSDLSSAERVAAAAMAHVNKVLGDGASPDDIDDDIAAAVAERLWILVLSERQEKHLTMMPKHLAVIRAHDVEAAANA